MIALVSFLLISAKTTGMRLNFVDRFLSNICICQRQLIIIQIDPMSILIDHFLLQWINSSLLHIFSQQQKVEQYCVLSIFYSMLDHLFVIARVYLLWPPQR